MTISRRGLIAAAAGAAVLPGTRARAQAPTVKIGVLNDQSGPYRDDGGLISVMCARLAAQEFAPHGFAVEIVTADHQNKPDVGANIARQWFDRDGVDVILDLPTSSVALAVSSIGREKNKVVLTSGAGTSALTSTQCSPNTIQWTYDTYMLSKSTAGSLVKQGGDSWFFITADYVFGHSLHDDAAHFVEAGGGRVIGNVAYPFPGTDDFSSFLVQAKSSGAKVIGFANAGGDALNCVKQATEFGLPQSGVKLATLLMQLGEINALGLEVAQGLFLTESYYWDLNDRTRAWTRRIMAKQPSQMPAMTQAGCYSATLHYLRTVAAMGAAAAKADGAATIARMKAMPTDDDCFGACSIRADGRMLAPAYLFQVKSPAESRSKWDLYKLAATTPGPDAYRPLAEGHCGFVHA